MEQVVSLSLVLALGGSPSPSPSPSPVDCTKCKKECKSPPPWKPPCFDCCSAKVLNLATKTELEYVVGLSPAVATQIVNSNKTFLTLGDVNAVVGDENYGKVRDALTNPKRPSEVGSIVKRDARPKTNEVKPKTNEAKPKTLEMPAETLEQRRKNAAPRPTPTPTPNS